MVTNLPDSLASNSETKFSITITKPELNNFAKYQIDLPEGAVAEEDESLGGTFSYENKRAKIVWVIAPTDSVFVVSMKLITGALTGSFTIEQKFSYILDGNRKEVNAVPRRIFITKATKSDRKMIAGPKSIDTPVLPKVENINPPSDQAIASNQNLANQGNYAQQLVAMKQQALQFREDSRKAYELGSKEKEEAEKNLADAEEALKKANALESEAERTQANNNAKLMKERAEASASAADKILQLSRSLENEAIELETAIEERTAQAGNVNSAGESIDTDAQTQGTLSIANNSIAIPGYENKKIDRLSQKEMEELRQQAAQFRKDAADALEVGLKEKALAEKKLQEAQATIQNSEDIKNKNERKKVLAKGEASKQKAEADLQTSEKIIILSRTLEENANEIERLIEYLQPANSLSTSPTEPDETETLPAPAETVEAPLVKENTVPIESANTIYMLQVGAFNNKPDKAVLKKLGKYRIVTEDNRYKVLVGPFASKEEALAKREELLPKGFDGFVVVYEKGRRKK